MKKRQIYLLRKNLSRRNVEKDNYALKTGIDKDIKKNRRQNTVMNLQIPVAQWK